LRERHWNSRKRSRGSKGNSRSTSKSLRIRRRLRGSINRMKRSKGKLRRAGSRCNKRFKQLSST
jgi:hypothetical protein